MNNPESLRKVKEEWKEKKVLPLLRKFPERKNQFKTSFDSDIDILYTPEDLPPDGYDKALGFPGQYPFTRGVQPTMYRGRLWTMRQYAGFGTAEESNERYRYLLSQGQTGLSVAFDLPTQIGYDSDDPMAEGEVGKVGVAIDSLEDMEILFEGIPLDKVSTSMTINSTAAILLAMYIAVGEKQGVDPSKLTGTIQNDILKEYIARGTYIFPPDASMRLITDIFEYCSKKLPEFNTISISGYHIREAGADAVQEVAFTLADGIAYVESAIKAGLDPNIFGKRLSFFFNSHNNFLEEIAKFRAARRLWAKIMKDRFGVTDEKAMMLRFHTQTGGSTLTAQQPMNNIIRVAFQAMAAVLGGTQSLHTNSFDEALGLPTQDSVTIALRTQQIIACETGVTDTVDPVGGSYYVENLTDRIEKLASDYLQKIDDLGGMVKAVQEGYIQKEILKTAYNYQLKIEREEQVIVGVNQYLSDENPKKDILKIDPIIEEKQINKLGTLKRRRNSQAVEEALKELKKAALGSENLFPFILNAVKCYATLGEISNTLRDVFGEYTEAVIL
ncbi:MAG TPA: methylmalonyl-CoA mutase family protein [Mesotoga infera]|jgi:methylmalonyl-CoA mutase N-terminal domain/subunit|uniref:acyl-CoA mutase large subunit family protein n=1 Tax=Mesotoga infera TaxID=1236046 RepID=UPI000AD91793|nr:methylmalonyl-CoA mutase family protein [Mesotoga infera]MBP8659875.1 methylmalonyl-CoA mutase family protein [Mesotoga sp.]NLI05811.1 methylmalonyl-CoA mutase family protein [Thermotogaceae bacterium]HNS67189.1 methylmalonyl-CoA mutase family protein [Mesotoga infera]HOI34139.1 methylmalonyl-CoA mutase family protein [Mesotoga infera]HPD36997.1 methylmalonyl-CoA mutase family protein [Mesotoga infera]